jgi:ferritin-like metal-binding protein YciE
LIEKATNRELTSGLSSHLRETEGQIVRLEQVFAKLGQTPRGIDCPAIDGLINEADEVAGEVDDTKVLDAAIIGSAQAVEHYEIARYGTLIAWAEELGHDKVISLFNANLKEEKAADKKLNALAEGTVNRRATGRASRDSATPRSGSVRAATHGLTKKRTGRRSELLARRKNNARGDVQ